MEDYPRIEKTNKGLVVQVSKGASLPGVYTDYLRAERAIERYKSKAKSRKTQTKKK